LKLYELQQVDSALARADTHRRGLDDGAAKRVEIKGAASRLEALNRNLAAAQTRLRTLDLEVQSLRAKAGKLEADMYSGRIGNPKELSAMQEDVAAIGRRVQHLEDESLAVMEEVESREAERRRAQEELKAAEAALARVVEAYERDSGDADREIASLTARREVLAAEVDEAVLRRYERLRAAKSGVAVVEVKGGICVGCHVAVPERLVSRLGRDPDLLAACDGCGRLLVVLTTGSP
jgi:predicted  nucleic acid-binding Zn-ribbon protein